MTDLIKINPFAYNKTICILKNVLHFATGTQCLKITQNIAFLPIFVLSKLTCLVTLFSKTSVIFKHCWGEYILNMNTFTMIGIRYSISSYRMDGKYSIEVTEWSELINCLHNKYIGLVYLCLDLLLQILLRARFLEDENARLREEMQSSFAEKASMQETIHRLNQRLQHFTSNDHTKAPTTTTTSSSSNSEVRQSALFSWN